MMSFEEEFPTLSEIYYIPENMISMGVDSEDIRKYCLDKSKVLQAIQTALPCYTFGGNTPSDETMSYFRSIRKFLYEQLGFVDEYKKEFGGEE